MIGWSIAIIMLITNLFTIFYCRFLLKNLVILSESTKDMRTLFKGFEGHVEALHELEMFYGDETLKSMIEHSKFVVEQINQYDEALALTDQEDEIKHEEEKEEN